MLRRPTYLVFLSIMFISIAVAFPLKIFFTYFDSVSDVSLVLTRMTPWKWLTITSLLITAGLVIECHVFAIAALPINIFIVLFNNVLLVSSSPVSTRGTAAIISFGFLLLHVPLTQSKIWRPFLDPSARWWRKPKRERVRVDLRVQRLNGDIFSAYSFDLSKAGVFIPFFSVQSNLYTDYNPPFIPNEKEYVRLDFSVKNTMINCQAQVVRKCEARGSYPPGVGLRFINLNKQEERIISRFIKNARQFPEVQNLYSNF